MSLFEPLKGLKKFSNIIELALFYCQANSTLFYCQANSTLFYCHANSTLFYCQANSTLFYRQANSTLFYCQVNSTSLLQNLVEFLFVDKMNTNLELLRYFQLGLKFIFFRHIYLKYRFQILFFPPDTGINHKFLSTRIMFML